VATPTGTTRSPTWWWRARAAAGIVGPAAFTAAWLVNSRRQVDYPARHEHISGLAAMDADHPHSMMAGFIVLGAGTVLFAQELRRVLGARRAGWGPRVLAIGGLAAITAGLLRRDTVLLNPPGRHPDYRQSWRNDGHDIAAGVIYTTSVAAPILLAARFRDDPAWAPLVPGALLSSAASVLLMVYFSADVDRHGNGVVQRVMVTIPQAFMAALAVTVLRRETS
jgi:hypothetical protein